MKIWIMNHYARHMEKDKGGRHYWFAKFLAQKGHAPTVFCAETRGKALFEASYDEEISTKFVYVRVDGSHNGKLARVQSMLSFYRNVQKTARKLAKAEGTPDVIMASSVHPFTLIAGLRLAKKFGIKCICEMRDLWPEAIFAYSDLDRNSLIGKLLYRGERWIYAKADALVFTQEGAADYIRSHKWDTRQGGPIDMAKVHYINNGVDLEAFDKNAAAFVFEDADLDDPDLYKVVYAGAIRRVNDIELLLDAAKRITDPAVRFLIFGEGDRLPALQQRVIDEKITNVVFKGKVNKQLIPSITSRADLNLAHWKMTPLVQLLGESCNKVFEYCAAGKPMLYTVHPSYSIAKKFDCGEFTEGFTAEDVANAVMKCKNLSQQRKAELSRNARTAAEHFDFKNLTDELLKVIAELQK